MRIVCLCNNWLGWQVVQWLAGQGEEIAGVVVHPREQAKYLDEIQATAKSARAPVFEDSMTQEGVAQIRALKADMAISVLFRNILRKSFLDLFPKGCINLHPAFLPYNRGAYPNVWSIIEQTPAGVTLHYIDEGIDTGDLVAQEKVTVEPTDTGATLYRKLELAALELFQRTWPSLVSGHAVRKPQTASSGTVHRRADVAAIDEIELDRSYRAKDLIDILRARTFAPYPGAYFLHNGKKVYLRLELRDGSAPEGGDR